MTFMKTLTWGILIYSSTSLQLPRGSRGAERSSVVECPLMVLWVIRLIELFCHSGQRSTHTSHPLSVYRQFGLFINMYFSLLKVYIRRKEENVLFNDTLNTFYLWLYGKEPLRKQERKPAAATWAALSD